MIEKAKVDEKNYRYSSVIEELLEKPFMIGDEKL